MKKLKVICKLTRNCETQDGFYSFLFNGYEMKIPCDTVVFYAQNLKDAIASIQLQEIEIINTSWEN